MVIIRFEAWHLTDSGSGILEELESRLRAVVDSFAESNDPPQIASCIAIGHIETVDQVFDATRNVRENFGLGAKPFALYSCPLEEGGFIDVPLTAEDRFPKLGDELMKVGAFMKQGAAKVDAISDRGFHCQYGTISVELREWHYIKRADDGPISRKEVA